MSESADYSSVSPRTQLVPQRSRLTMGPNNEYTVLATEGAIVAGVSAWLWRVTTWLWESRKERSELAVEIARLSVTVESLREDVGEVRRFLMGGHAR